jgi:hypothetical protein
VRQKRDPLPPLVATTVDDGRRLMTYKVFAALAVCDGSLDCEQTSGVSVGFGHIPISPLPAHTSTVGGGDLPRVELRGDCIEARVAGRLNVPNDWQDIGRKLRRPRLAGHAHVPDGARGVGRRRCVS